MGNEFVAFSFLGKTNRGGTGSICVMPSIMVEFKGVSQAKDEDYQIASHNINMANKKCLVSNTWVASPKQCQMA